MTPTPARLLTRCCLVLLALGMPLVGHAQLPRIEMRTPFIQLQPVSTPGLVALPDAIAAQFPQQQALRSAYATGQHEQALTLAQTLLGASRQRFGAQDPRLADFLVNLAAVQQQAGAYAAAAVTSRRVIALLRAVSSNARDPRLARPLYGLGVALYSAGEYREAAVALQRAAFVVRVNQGLDSRAQLQMYPALTQAYIALGDYDDAVKRQQARVAIVAAAAGADSPDLIGTLADAAGWLRRMGRYEDERRMQQRRVDILRDKYGNNDVRLMRPLLALAATYQHGFLPDIMALQSIQQAEGIEKKHPQRPPVERARTLIALGDFYLTFHASNRATGYYRQAYDLLTKAGKTQQRAALLGQPRLVFLPPPKPLPGVGEPPAAGLPAGTIKLRFTVDVYGELHNIKVLSLQPKSAGRMRTRIRFALRDARFRPRISDKGALRSKNVDFTYRFRYLPSAPDNDS